MCHHSQFHSQIIICFLSSFSLDHDLHKNKDMHILSSEVQAEFIYTLEAFGSADRAQKVPHV